MPSKHRTLLTPRQLAFAQAAASGATLFDAALFAGYSRETAKAQATRLARHPRIAAEITHRQIAHAASRELSVEWWRTELADAYRASRDTADMTNRLRALELAGKHLGLLDTGRDQGQAELAARVLTLLAEAGRGARALTGMTADDSAGGNVGSQGPVRGAQVIDAGGQDDTDARAAR